jgi:Bacterial Ig-like domain (group 3)
MRDIKIAPYVFLLSLLLMICSPALAQKAYTDKFEAPSINPFWTILDHAGTGSVNLDTDLAHSGKQSVEVTTESYGGVEALSHSSPSPLYGTVSVWVYYANVYGTGYKQLDIFAGPAFSGNDYNLYIDWGDLQTYLYDSSGALHVLAPDQSTGWHQWFFSSVSGGVTIKIDGATVFTQTTPFTFQTVNLQQCCDAGSAFFDDFSFAPAAITTTTTLFTSPNPSAFGQLVSFVANVTSAKGAPPDGELVAFDQGSTLLGTGVLSGGSANFTTTNLAAGNDTVKAVYYGDLDFQTSTSKAVKQIVNQATTQTTLTSSQNPSNSAQAVTFTANVVSQFGAAVIGPVTFYDGTTALHTASVKSGSATFTTKKLTLGVHTITSTYDGNKDFEESSASLTQTVN